MKQDLGSLSRRVARSAPPLLKRRAVFFIYVELYFNSGHVAGKISRALATNERSFVTRPRVVSRGRNEELEMKSASKSACERSRRRWIIHCRVASRRAKCERTLIATRYTLSRLP